MATAAKTPGYRMGAYSELYDGMNACNSFALISSEHWKDAVLADDTLPGQGTDRRNAHPLLVILADKLRQLAGNADPVDAMSFVHRVASGELIPGSAEYSAALNDYYKKVGV